MKSTILTLSFCLSILIQASGQINARLMRFLDVSDTQICFVYGGDIWVMPKEGGQAVQVTHSPGEESYPRFSPDGTSIAYTAAYNGNLDVYVMPSIGGVPTRLTYSSFSDRMIEWHPDGNSLLFASARESGMSRYRQFYEIPVTGGYPKKLKVPYGELASYSADGKQLAYITKITENYPFKRYRGGLASDIILYDLENNTAENITENRATDGKPAWVGDHVYFVSDQDKEMRMNLWKYNTKTKATSQVTFFKDFDISYMSAGGKEIVFEKGGNLYLLDTSNDEFKPVEANVISDLSVEMPRSVSVGSRVNNMTPSPKGERIVFEARGELFDVPKKEGYVENLTQSSGSFERNPSWSPDGKTLAYWSDVSGEFEVYLKDMTGDRKTRKLTDRKKGFGYNLHWSPDGKKLAFIDETNQIFMMDVASGASKVIGSYRWNYGHGGRFFYDISWSPDAKWIAYTKGMENSNDAIFLYSVDKDTSYQVTSSFFSDNSPVFSEDGKYLFFQTVRNFQANYSSMGDGTWIYPNATQVAVMNLTPDVPSLLVPKNDTVEVEEEEKKEEEEETKKKGKKKKKDDKEVEEKKDEKKVEIQLAGLESRVEILPIKAGNIGKLIALKGKLIYQRYPNTGSGQRSAALKLYDFDKKEEKEIMGNVSRFELTAESKSLLVASGRKYGIIKAEPGQKLDKTVPMDGLVMNLVPREEWKQIFKDTWRRHRDFFYDPAMHGLDWEAVGKQYEDLLDDARTRWDVSFLQSNLVSELSAGHTYTFGGDNENIQFKSNGFLGIDWDVDEKGYKIKRIVKPAPWDTEIRSALDRSGLDVAEGHYIHSVNGISIDPARAPYAAFENLSGKVVSLQISNDGNLANSKRHIIKCLTQGEETQLRYLEWIENNRKKVDELSDGKLGYVYMSNTSSRGQLELVKMYYGQLEKEGFIIDERFNGGGQLADRFLELLTRPVVYNLHWRHGKDHTWPIKTNTGPMAMLINGQAGSGGDGLPWAFQELKAGPIIGERTLGILVGPATGHSLIDGGGITVPGARLYDNDGHWFWEGEGVAPDIEVWDDPNQLVKGVDPQLERAVKEVLDLLETQKMEMTPAPASEIRTAQGLGGK